MTSAWHSISEKTPSDRRPRYAWHCRAIANRTSITQFANNGDGARTSKTGGGDTTQYVLDLAATLPVVISDTEAAYLYGLDILAEQQTERQYHLHDGLGSVRLLASIP